jgi:3-deoxy-D-manno-octulosonic-acid transferase
MRRSVYRLLAHGLWPVALARAAWRARALGDDLRRLPERLGAGTVPPAGALWVHAVSVGEVNAAAPLIETLRARGAGSILLTTVTPTGAQRAGALLGPEVTHRYLPYDVPFAVRAFLDRARPRAGIVMETELWPELYHACAARGVPLALVNARLSARSAEGYRRLGGLVRQTLACARVIAAQSEADAARLRALGAPADRVHVTGSVKFDQPEPDRAGARALRAACAGRPVWFGASTHAGEERQLLAAHAQVRRRHANALLVLAPRHPQRFDAVAATCAQAGFVPARRSNGENPAGAAVYLVDTLGELAGLYGAADAAFVGGSWVNAGGHNLIEPAAAGVPCLFGPHMHNFAQLREWVLQAGAGVQVQSPDMLARHLEALWDDPARAARMGAAGRALVAAHRGALARTVRLLESTILA